MGLKHTKNVREDEAIVVVGGIASPISYAWLFPVDT